MIFVGALIKLLGRGRVSAVGTALAGFALVLFGLTTLQQGSSLAERLHPTDLPVVFGANVGWGTSLFGVLALVLIGVAMTTVMQSSTAAIAVTLSAYFAGAVGLDQACALIIGQNIGSATSSAIFPVAIPLLARVSNTIDGVTLLAGYHMAYDVVGVAVLLPLIDRFTRFVERILPERGSPLYALSRPAALVTPLAAEEAVRRTVGACLERCADQSARR
jgi:phosphate:Na+ symporter